MKRELVVEPTPQAAAARAGRLLAERARVAVAERGRFMLALSGGSTPRRLLAELAREDLPWSRIAVYQVDERVAPRGDPGRNLTLLLAALPPAAHASVCPLPVEEEDLDAAARRYESELPDALDLVQLGLGADGHTASLFPGDPVLEVRDRRVATTGKHRGHRRLTLTYPTLAAAREALWLVTGPEKRAALARLLAGDPALPAARVATPRQLVVADAAAAG